MLFKIKIKMIKKIKNGIAKYGYFGILKKIILYPYTFYLYKKNTKFLSLKNNKDRFTEIYKSNYWDNDESVSGPGSTIKNTEKLRSELPSLLKKFNISTILDAPCGDFNWMKLFLRNNKLIKYTGGDIVVEIIKKNNQLYKNNAVTFVKLDITNDILPECDLMICRDCLIHFSYNDINKFLINFNKSKIKYLLTTNFHFNKKNYQENKDILTGDYRLINLQTKPFNFPNPLSGIKEYDYGEMGSVHMDLYDKSQISLIKIFKK